MSKFGSLAANVDETFRVEIIDEITDLPLTDKDGNPAYIDVLSTESDPGLEFDRDKRSRDRRSAMKSRTGMPDDSDPLEDNHRKLAKLTKAWHLVDPHTREKIDVPCNAANALELYSAKGMNWLFIQAWVGASKAANFMKKASPTSSNGQSANSGTAGA